MRAAVGPDGNLLDLVFCKLNSDSEGNMTSGRTPVAEFNWYELPRVEVF